MTDNTQYYDIIIIGAGPAGCSAAINLQPGLRVALIDRTEKAQFKIGESLPPEYLGFRYGESSSNMSGFT